METKRAAIEHIKNESFIIRETAQAAIEGALPLPAGVRLGDIEPICIKASIDYAEAAVRTGAIDISGRIRVNVIFKSAKAEDTAEQVYRERGGAFTSSAAFKYSLACDAAETGMRAEVYSTVTACSFTVGEELMLNAVAGLDCALFAAEGTRVPSLGNDIEVKTKSLSSWQEELIGRTETTIEAETALMANAEPIFASGECCVRNAITGADTAIIEGQLMLDMLLSTRSGMTEHMVQLPFSVEAELTKRCTGEAAAKVKLKDISVCAEDVSSGMATVRAALEISVYSASKNEGEICEDAFCPLTGQCAVTENVGIMQRGRRKAYRHNISEVLPLSDAQSTPNGVICCMAMPYITDSYVKDGILHADGVICVNAALRSGTAEAYTFTTEVPFFSEAQYAFDDTNGVFAEVRCLSSSLMLTGGGMMLECALEISAVPYTILNTTAVCEMGEAQQTASHHALVLYYAAEGETPFDIAKRYFLSVDKIRSAANGSTTLNEGDRLIFLL